MGLMPGCHKSCLKVVVLCILLLCLLRVLFSTIIHVTPVRFPSQEHKFQWMHAIREHDLKPHEASDVVGKETLQKPTGRETKPSGIERKNTSNERFIFYQCDQKDKCHGLGDRARGIITSYLLALVSGRTFGIIFTYPCDIKKFLVPNQVSWEIPKERYAGKINKTLGRRLGLDFKVPFNTLYPEDVVYMTPMFDVLPQILKNNYGASYIPLDQRTFGEIWLKLFKPVASVRRLMNQMLTSISISMQEDDKIQRHFRSGVCRNACDILAQQPDPSKPGEKAIEHCISHLKSDKIIFSHGNTSKEEYGVNEMLLYCPLKEMIKHSFQPPKVGSIQQSTGFDLVNLTLVCVHLRIGKNPSMPNDLRRNPVDTLEPLWDFLWQMVRRGQHVYLATDDVRMREVARNLFGHRVHFSEALPAHIDQEVDKQKAIDGFRLAVWENLLLATSCDTFVMSKSTFSNLAEHMRTVLMKTGRKTYLFRSETLIRVV